MFQLKNKLTLLVIASIVAVAIFFRFSATNQHLQTVRLHETSRQLLEASNQHYMNFIYTQISELENQISALRSQIREIEKEEAKAKVFSEEGLTFEKARNVQMKFNFTPRITKLKLVDVNAKGTRAKAVFTFAHGDYVSSEENVNVQKILEQVI